MWFLFAWRQYRRRRGQPAERPVANGAATGAEGSTAVRIIRRWVLWTARGNTYDVLVDGEVRGKLKTGKTIDIAVAPGSHSLRLEVAEVENPTSPDPRGHVFVSKTMAFEVRSGQTVVFMSGPGPTAYQPFRNVNGDAHPDVMLKPKAPGASWRTYD